MMTPKAAFEAGEKAKRNAWARLSPFYGDLIADNFFFAGYDGLSLATAMEKYPVLDADKLAEVRTLLRKRIHESISAPMAKELLS